MTDYRIEELLVCRIASEVTNAGVTVLGSFTPLAYASYMLAKLTTAPEAYLVGFNGMGIPPVQLNMTGVEGAIYRGALARWTFCQLTGAVHLGKRGLVECVSPAQFDGNGAFNLSCIGDHAHPKVRLPGGAGAPEVVQHYERILVYVGRHDHRTLPAAVDFRTGQRAPVNADRRKELGLLAGPITLITPLGVLSKETEERPFRLETLHPGARISDVEENTGFEVEIPSEVPPTPEPTPDQITLLREQIDPYGTIRFDFMDAQSRRAYIRDLLDGEWQRALHAAQQSTGVPTS